LADEITVYDAERVIDIWKSRMGSIGVDPELGEWDADIV